MLYPNVETFIGCDSSYRAASIVLYGAPYDSTTSYRPGARFGPAAIRHESYGLETYSPYQNADLTDFDIFDSGDLELCFGSSELALADIEARAEEILKDIAPRYEYENEEYRIIVPRNLVDIMSEGNALHHCVGSTDRYFERIRDQETYICFLRRQEEPELPYYTIEVEPGGTIRQHRGMYDEEPNIEEIRGFLREWQRVLKKRLHSKDWQLAAESKVKRDKNLEELRKANNERVLKGLAEDFMEAV